MHKSHLPDILLGIDLSVLVGQILNLITTLLTSGIGSLKVSPKILPQLWVAMGVPDPNIPDLVPSSLRCFEVSR